MDYFRKLVSDNASLIWGRGVDRGRDYELLSREILKLTENAVQATKIVESIDLGDRGVFKDFDLSGFMEHFKMSAIEKIILASAFKRASKSDLRTKGTFFSSFFQARVVANIFKPTPSSQTICRISSYQSRHL